MPSILLAVSFFCFQENSTLFNHNYYLDLTVNTKGNELTAQALPSGMEGPTDGTKERNVMQIQKIARRIQEEDCPLQFILFICMDT